MAFGIPPLLNKAFNTYNKVSLLISDVKMFLGLNTPKWGIFNTGTTKSAITFNSFNAVDFSNEFNICTYPLEQGSFSDYNKVTLPYSINVRITISGELSKRTDFFNTLEKISKSTNLYDVVTPEKTYLSASIAKYDYMRTATNGAQVIIVDLKLIEIRTTGKTAFNNSTKVGSIVPQFSPASCLAPPSLSSLSLGQLNLGLPPIPSINNDIIASVTAVAKPPFISKVTSLI